MSNTDLKSLGLNPDLWDFPKSHSIKAIGLSTDPVQDILLGILTDMGLAYEINAIKSTPSKNNKYTSVTVKTLLRNAQEVTELYKRLFQHPQIIRAL